MRLAIRGNAAADFRRDRLRAHLAHTHGVHPENAAADFRMDRFRRVERKLDQAAGELGVPWANPADESASAGPRRRLIDRVGRRSWPPKADYRNHYFLTRRFIILALSQDKKSSNSASFFKLRGEFSRPWLFLTGFQPSNGYCECHRERKAPGRNYLKLIKCAPSYRVT